LHSSWAPISTARGGPGVVARELPDLIEILHRPLGEIVDICINWSVTEAAVDLSSIVTGARWRQGDQRRRHRLMVAAGGQGCANLLVVPHISPHALATTVMRYAAGRRLPASQRDTEVVETADSVVTRGSRGVFVVGRPSRSRLGCRQKYCGARY
jgi:hypothetical protein